MIDQIVYKHGYGDKKSQITRFVFKPNFFQLFEYDKTHCYFKYEEQYRSINENYKITCGIWHIPIHDK